MPTWVGLLRAVNVGGRNRAPMETVRAAVADAGGNDVRTYLQSGNVVFRSSMRREGDVAAALEAALAERLGFAVGVVVRSAAEVERVRAANPFATDAAHLAVMFLDGPPTAPVAAGVVRVDDEAYALVGRDVFLHAPRGLGRSKLPALLSERRLGVRTTTRNWRTVGALAELASGRPGAAAVT